jgi:saposin
MNICSTDEKPMIVGNNRCTWGPSYWCSSLSNSRQCASIDHCSNQIWSQQAIEKKANDNICQYCEYIIEKLRSIITENQTEVNSKIEKSWKIFLCSFRSMWENG